MDSHAERSEQPIVLTLASEEREARSMNPFLRAALIAVAIHLAYFFVIDCLTLRHLGMFRSVAIAILGGLPIRLFQAPLAATAGIAVYGMWRLVRSFRKPRGATHVV
jgi:hypothetical protein